LNLHESERKVEALVTVCLSEISARRFFSVHKLAAYTVSHFANSPYLALAKLITQKARKGAQKSVKERRRGDAFDID